MANIWISDELGSEMNMEKQNERVLLVWTEIDGKMISGVWNSNITSDSIFRRDGDALIVTLGNGLEIAFQRIN